MGGAIVSRDKHLHGYRRQRPRATAMQQVALALIALAGIIGVAMVLWRVVAAFAILGDHLAST